MKKIAALLLGLTLLAFNALAAVNVNTATQQQLESLNGIGPAKAKAIIDYRTKNGPFKTVEELDNVPGIGQGILSKIRGDVTLTGQTTVKPEGKSAAKAEPKKAESGAADKKVDARSEKKDRKEAAKADKDTKKTAKAEQADKDAKKDAKKEAKKATTADKDAKADKKTAQQERMKSCNKQAADKQLKGDDRKKFMSTCLKS